MKITANEEYGLRILLRIAILSRANTESDLVTLSEIAQAEGITTDYAMIFLTTLKKSGLIESVRGKNGGYKLNKAPEAITLYEVSEALSEDFFGPEYCDNHSGSDKPHCVHQDGCTIRSVWSTISKVFRNVLKNITLDRLIDDEEKLNEELNQKLLSGELFKVA